MRIVKSGAVLADTEGPYTGAAGAGSIYQQFYPLPDFNGRRPVIGSWMVNGYACGIGIREDDSLVTGNLSRFVPHIINR